MKIIKDKSKKKRTILGVVMSGTVLGVGLIGSSYKILQNVVKPKTTDYHENYFRELEFGRFTEEEFHQMPKHEFNIPSDEGYDIHGYFFDNKSKKTVIIIHGITINLWSSMKYVKMFYERGFNVCIYDHRNHGLSGSDYTTLGLIERYDAKQVIRYVKELVGEDSVVGLHGESMGAGTAMMTLSVSGDIDFLIEDCGYSTMYEELKVRLKADHKLPAFPFLFLANGIMKIRYGLNLFKETPLKAVSESEVPVLFIHGGQDTYVPTYMVYDLFEAKIGPKELHVFDMAKHACSYLENREEYEQIIEDFLIKYGF